MWGLVIALAAAGSLVWLSATGPGRERARELARLVRLRRTLERGELDLEMAEDGAVLARRTRQAELEAKFEKQIEALKKHGRK